MNQTFHSAARNLVDDLASLLPTEAAAFTSSAQAYEQAFVERCAACCDDTRILIDVKTALRKIKGFSLRDFDKLVREEKSKIFGSGGVKPNGHAGGWEAMLLRTKEGKIKPLLANALTCLRLAPEWQGVLGFNELSCRPVKLKPPPFKSSEGNWVDEDDILTAEWLQRQGIEAGITTAAGAVQAASAEHSFHPIREYLSKLHWDGEKRLSHWLTTYLGVEWSEYVSAVGTKWLISAIARVQHPGCQVDTCLVLEGEQGIRKSSALRVLAGDEWFTDQLSDLSNKDSSQDLNGKWIVEFSDLGQMSRAEAGVLKAFLSRRVDHYRASYGRRTADFPRQCCFAASTNKDNWAGDETGGRRFWPVRCGEIDIAALTRDRDQLLAEALAEYNDGHHWWIEDEIVVRAASAEQEERFETDPWDEKVMTWIKEQEEAFNEEEAATAALWHRAPFPYSVSTDAILAGPLGKPVGIWTGFEKTRVARILTFHGFMKFKKYAAYADGIPLKDKKTGEYITERRYKRKPVRGT